MKRLGVIFDMDGVLVDSENAMKETSIESLERFGINPKKDDFVEFTGMGEDAFIGGVAGKYDLKYNHEMKDYAYMLYAKKAKELVYVYPQVKDILFEAKQHGFAIAVASAADLIKVEINLECIGIEMDFFDAVITGSDVKNKKPDPEIFIKAAETMEVAPGDCIVIEDAVSGIKAAQAAGMASIGITTAFCKDELLVLSPDYVTANIGEAYEKILNWETMKSR